MIVISGITSSIGISLAKLLASKGIRVVGFARSLSRVKNVLKDPLIELKVADLRDNDMMSRLCVVADAVVHLAALSSPWGKYSDFKSINVDGTESFVKAALKSNVKRFIHVSTPSIYFEFKDQFGITEDTKLPKRFVNSYAETKMKAEKIVDKAYFQGLGCITLRPKAVFGPFDQTLFPRVIQASQDGAFPCFSKKSPLVDITYVDNVAHAIWLSLIASKDCFGQKYNITNGEPKPLWDILETLLTMLSYRFERKYLPYSIAHPLSWLLEKKAKVMGTEPLITRYGAAILRFSQTLSIEKARKELQYDPQISINGGLKRYADWFQAQ